MTQEIQYVDNGDLAIYNGYSFRKDKKTGYFLSSQKIDGKRKRLHVYVWEFETGEKVRRGYHIHHKDGNKDNNDITNLAMITREEHEKLHANSLTSDRKKQMAENVIKYGVPAAKAWHRSKEGHEWHVQHGKEVAANLSYREYICTYCGKAFQTKNVYPADSNTFCSNNCKAAYRRKSGVDDIEKVCPICGETYKTNKYSPAKYCKKHNRGKH